MLVVYLRTNAFNHKCLYTTARVFLCSSRNMYAFFYVAWTLFPALNDSVQDLKQHGTNLEEFTYEDELHAEII